MTLLKGSTLEATVGLLKRRGVCFYHACQLRDFAAYTQIGGIPSRSLMERLGLPYTCFATDEKDHGNGVWPKVFGNLSDFGHGFASSNWSENKAPIPNPYGPILLVSHPEILLKSIDAAICLRSAGGSDFNRDAESLSLKQEIEMIFTHPSDEPNLQLRRYIKFSKDLKKKFSYLYPDSSCAPHTYNPEISCTAPHEYLTFDHLSYIMVDRFRIWGQPLIRYVADIAFHGGLRVEIRERSYINNRSEIMKDLVRILSDGLMPLHEIAKLDYISPITKDWALRVLSSGLNWQYERFANYLVEGTIGAAVDRCETL